MPAEEETNPDWRAKEGAMGWWDPVMGAEKIGAEENTGAATMGTAMGATTGGWVAGTGRAGAAILLRRRPKLFLRPVLLALIDPVGLATPTTGPARGTVALAPRR